MQNPAPNRNLATADNKTHLMIATLTLNPAIDKNLSVESLVPEKKMRCSAIHAEPGGGGINISKALQELGGDSTALYPAGGITGKELEELLRKEGISCCAIPIAGATRENFNVDETSTNRQYRFITPGPTISREELDRVRRAIEDLEGLDYLVCSGSLPPGVPSDFLAELSVLCRDKGTRFIADTSGEPLQKVLETGVYLVKPNVTELKSLAGIDYLEEEDIAKTAGEVMKRVKAEVMVVSMGPAGAVLVTRESHTRFQAPMVKKLSTVGAGDSMVAGIVWMLQQQKPLEEAVRFGIACGTAATMQKGTTLFRKADAEKLYKGMKGG